MIQTHDEALDYLQRNLATLNEAFVDFPKETLDILFMERFYEKLGPVMTEEQVEHLEDHADDQNYEDYSWTYLGQFVPGFFDLLTETIQEILHEVQGGSLGS